MLQVFLGISKEFKEKMYSFHDKAFTINECFCNSTTKTYLGSFNFIIRTTIFFTLHINRILTVIRSAFIHVNFIGLLLLLAYFLSQVR